MARADEEARADWEAWGDGIRARMHRADEDREANWGSESSEEGAD